MFSLFLLTSDQWSEFNHVPGPRWGLSSTKLMRLRPRSCWGSRATWSGMSAPWWPAPSPPHSTPGHSGQGRTRLERTSSIFLLLFSVFSAWCTQASAQISRDVFVERHQGCYWQESRKQDRNCQEICGMNDKNIHGKIRIMSIFSHQVRVRNHAKMVDCYLTTFKNNKGIFGDKKKVSQDIIENPSKYHIYEGIKIFSS